MTLVVPKAQAGAAGCPQAPRPTLLLPTPSHQWGCLVWPLEHTRGAKHSRCASTYGREKTRALLEACSFWSRLMTSKSLERSLGSCRWPLTPPQPSELSAQTLPQSSTLRNTLVPKPHAALGLSCPPDPCIQRTLPLTYHPALTHHSWPGDSNVTWLSICYASGTDWRTPVPAGTTGLSRGQTAPVAGLPFWCWLLPWAHFGSLEIQENPFKELSHLPKMSYLDPWREVGRHRLESSRPGPELSLLWALGPLKSLWPL